MAVSRIKNQEWFKGMLDFVFPPLCLGCGEYCESESAICSDCLKSIEQFDNPMCLNCDSFIPNETTCPICLEDSALMFAYGDYKPPLKDIIVNFKFYGITTPAMTFACLISEKFDEKLRSLNPDALIPIPLHPTRRNYRGYNQAELISKELSIHLGIDTATDVLHRAKKRKPQARLDMKKRAKNIRDVFFVDSADERNENVILIDDVVTSGATVMEAKKCLEKSKYNVVGVIAIAHGI